MKKFDEKYNLSSQEVLRGLIKYIGETHEAIQNLEAGMESTNNDKATASFMFVELIGYLPDQLHNGKKLINVATKALGAEADGVYSVFYEMENGDITKFPIFGPGSGAKAVMAKAEDIKALIKAAFPKAVIQTTTGTSKLGATVYHTTVRPGFMQNASTLGFPVESGSAECSNEVVSLMQATVRMIAARVMGYMVAALALDLHKMTTRQKNKTLNDLAKEKYGDRNWEDLVNQIMKPNSLFDVLFKNQTDPKVNGRYTAKAPDYMKQSAYAETKTKAETDDLVKSLEAIFGKGNVKVIDR